MNYLHWNQKTITDFSEKAVSEMYIKGFVFTRIGKGVMQQTRSCRINLKRFELSSENRRILKKTGDIGMQDVELPLHDGYDWAIGKLGKDFYDSKFGKGTMSAQKIKEMMTEYPKSNFNRLLIYSLGEKPVGYAITYTNKKMLHYSFPFYNLDNSPKDMGLGMMIRAIEWAKDEKMDYMYIGSLQRPGDTYKLQFEGLEWFDGGKDGESGTNKWSTDIEKVKKILSAL